MAGAGTCPESVRAVPGGYHRGHARCPFDPGHHLCFCQSAKIRQAFASDSQPFYSASLAALYAARNMQPIWQDHDAVQKFQQQLAEVALSGVQPQFTRWVERLTDPSITGFARDVTLSDAMLGYLQFVSSVPAQGETWLYSTVPYKLAVPSVSVINAWQNAVNAGRQRPL